MMMVASYGYLSSDWYVSKGKVGRLIELPENMDIAIH